MIKELYPYLAPFKKKLIFNVFLGVIYGVSTVLITFFIGRSITAFGDDRLVDTSLLIQSLVLIALFTILSSLSFYILQRVSQAIAYQSAEKMREKLARKLNKLPMSYFDSTTEGNTMTRFTSDVDHISEATLVVLNQLFPGVAIIVLAFVIMIQLNIFLTIVVLVTTIFMILVNLVISKKSQSYFHTQLEITGEFSGYLKEQIEELKTTKAYQNEFNVRDNVEDLNTRLQVVGQKAQFVSSLTNPISRFVDHLGYITTGALGGYLIITATGDVTLGMLSSFIIYSGQFSKPIIEFSSITTQWQTAIASMNRLESLFDEQEELPRVTSKKYQKHIFRGQVDFCDVSFSYHSDVPLISNFNLNVEPGQTVAIVGKTGAGKSTIVNLLMAFYDVTSGDILIDGIKLTELSREKLHSLFGMVLQDTWLFDGTIRENLVFGKENVSEQRLIDACQDTSIYQFIDSLPKGFDTVIGSEGMSLSSGQKQLLTIARTMVGDPLMLILDEATSSIDTLTELSVQKAFDTMMIGKTSFIIAHRLSTIKQADLILVMDKGQIVETGTHQQLLQKDNGHYRLLHDAQFSN